MRQRPVVRMRNVVPENHKQNNGSVRAEKYGTQKNEHDGTRSNGMARGYE